MTMIIRFEWQYHYLTMARKWNKGYSGVPFQAKSPVFSPNTRRTIIHQQGGNQILYYT
jgi:hypothetical protein